MSKPKSCACCRRACREGIGLCPACQVAGCKPAGYGAFNRGQACPVKQRGRNGAAATRASRRTA